MDKNHELSQVQENRMSSIPLMIILGLLLLGAITLTRIHSYLLFHGFAEIFSVVIACGIFMITWNTRRFLDNSYLLFLGITYLFIALIDLIHTLSYYGMNIFTGYDTNLPTQLWIIARFMESATLLVAPFLLRKKLRPVSLMAVYGVLTSILLWSAFAEFFPTCYMEDEGLTTFKKVSEYVISAMLFASLFLIYRKRDEFEQNVVWLLGVSIIFTIVSEMSFTLYTDTYGLFNMIGHLLKVVSFYLIYLAIVHTGLNKPYSLLFRNLRLSKEALQTSELHYRTLVESSPDGIIALDPQGNIMDCNESISGLLGYSRDEIRKKNLRDLMPESILDSLLYYHDHIDRNNQLEDEFELVHQNGKSIPVWAKMSPVYDTHGNLLQFVIYFRDIAERRRIDNLKDEFIGLVSHELRNPLTIIIGGINTAISERERLTQGEVNQLLQDSAFEAESLSHLIGNLLELSRFQANRFLLYPESIDLKDTASHMVKRIQSQFPLHHFVIRFSSDLPPVHADQLRLERILYNLLENACKYSPKDSTIIIFAELEKEQLTIGVQDEGEGISEEEQASLFEPFERLQRHIFSGITGTGLGLSVCKRLVEAHGGNIWTESILKKGTTFYFSLPLR